MVCLVAMASTTSSWPFISVSSRAACAVGLSRCAFARFLCNCTHLGLKFKGSTQNPRVSDELHPNKQKNSAFLGLGLGFQSSKLHSRAALAHVSTYADLDTDSHKQQDLRSGLHVNELPASAYVHLPFCKRRCFYCDFAIVAVGERNKENATHIDSTMGAYVDSVCTEITSTFKQWHKVRPLKTLFFGGGTPSLLPAHHLSRIIGSLEHCCGLENDVEISMEMDPGTFTELALREFLDCGVNRISLGVQAFHHDLLKACGRSHGLQDVYEAIDMIQASDIHNWSLDLICSLPNQTLKLWEESLRKAIDVAPAHISVYDLQIEEGTKFGVWYKPGQHPLPNEENSAAFYRLASSLLREAGYEHYEISNYAKPGYQCRHNLVYWRNEPYYAFGLGATSYVHGQRFSRPRKWKEYAEFVKELECRMLHGKEGECGSVKNAELSVHNANASENIVDRICDTIMLSLRLARGLDLHHISQAFGHAWAACICKAFVTFVDSGHAIALDGNLESMSPKVFSDLISYSSAPSSVRGIAFIRLADPEGFLLSNEIIASVFSSLPCK